MGKGGKGQPAHAFAFQGSATGSSWLNPRSGHLDLAGFQSAINSHHLTGSRGALDSPGMRDALLEMTKGNNLNSSDRFIGGVGMGMLDGRGVSPEQAAANSARAGPRTSATGASSATSARPCSR
jgi:hypothetical protein